MTWTYFERDRVMRDAKKAADGAAQNTREVQELRKQVQTLQEQQRTLIEAFREMTREMQRMREDMYPTTETTKKGLRRPEGENSSHKTGAAKPFKP